jgi:hypothetical protein
MTNIFCACCAWGFIIISVCGFWQTLKKGTHHIKKLHDIPCAGCDFFTNDYRLKCTINPIKACTEDAIGCIDFEPKTTRCNACQKGKKNWEKD